MNAPSRRQKIEAMLATEPRDAFLRYSLAMETQKEGDHVRSLDLLRELMADNPPYIPAFLMCGQQLVQLGRIDDARSALRGGIEAARAQNNAHAAGEMSELLASLGRLGE
jgi:thioredoxin-like negative regulator of GroEL